MQNQGNTAGRAGFVCAIVTFVSAVVACKGMQDFSGIPIWLVALSALALAVFGMLTLLFLGTPTVGTHVGRETEIEKLRRENEQLKQDAGLTNALFMGIAIDEIFGHKKY